MGPSNGAGLRALLILMALIAADARLFRPGYLQSQQRTCPSCVLPPAITMDALQGSWSGQCATYGYTDPATNFNVFECLPDWQKPFIVPIDMGFGRQQPNRPQFTVFGDFGNATTLEYAWEHNTWANDTDCTHGESDVWRLGGAYASGQWEVSAINPKATGRPDVIAACVDFTFPWKTDGPQKVAMVMQCVNGEIRLGFAAKQRVPNRGFLNFCDSPSGTQWDFSTPVTSMDILANYQAVDNMLVCDYENIQICALERIGGFQHPDHILDNIIVTLPAGTPMPPPPVPPSAGVFSPGQDEPYTCDVPITTPGFPSCDICRQPNMTRVIPLPLHGIQGDALPASLPSYEENCALWRQPGMIGGAIIFSMKTIKPGALPLYRRTTQAMGDVYSGKHPDYTLPTGFGLNAGIHSWMTSVDWTGKHRNPLLNSSDTVVNELHFFTSESAFLSHVLAPGPNITDGLAGSIRSYNYGWYGPASTCNRAIQEGNYMKRIGAGPDANYWIVHWPGNSSDQYPSEMRGFIMNSVVDYITLPGQPPLPLCKGTRLRVSNEVRQRPIALFINATVSSYAQYQARAQSVAQNLRTMTCVASWVTYPEPAYATAPGTYLFSGAMWFNSPECMAEALLFPSDGPLDHKNIVSAWLGTMTDLHIMYMGAANNSITEIAIREGVSAMAPQLNKDHLTIWLNGIDQGWMLNEVIDINGGSWGDPRVLLGNFLGLNECVTSPIPMPQPTVTPEFPELMSPQTSAPPTNPAPTPSPTPSPVPSPSSSNPPPSSGTPSPSSSTNMQGPFWRRRKSMK